MSIIVDTNTELGGLATQAVEHELRHMLKLSPFASAPTGLLEDLGVSKIDRVFLAQQLEEVLGVKLNTLHLKAFTVEAQTVADLAQALQNQLQVDAAMSLRRSFVEFINIRMQRLGVLA